jgi:hypothetical protein
MKTKYHVIIIFKRYYSLTSLFLIFLSSHGMSANYLKYYIKFLKFKNPID